MDLTDEQWEVLEPLIPDPPQREDSRGRPWRDPRDVLNGILWILRTGAPWKDLPERYPPYQTCHRRFQAWTEEGVLAGVLEALAQDLEERGRIDLSECYIDGYVRCGQKRGARVGKTKRGKGTKIMAFSDGSSIPLALHTPRECFAARSHPCWRDFGERLSEGEARAASGREGLRLRSSRGDARRARHRDDRAAQNEPQEEEDPGRAQAQALQEEMEDRASICLVAELQEVGGSLRIQGRELPGHGAAWLHPHPAQKVFMR